MKLGICSCPKRLVKSGVKFAVKNSGRFRASFPEEREAAKFHQNFHGIFHGDFHARFQEKISRQQFCTPCRGGNLFVSNGTPSGSTAATAYDEHTIVMCLTDCYSGYLRLRDGLPRQPRGLTILSLRFPALLIRKDVTKQMPHCGQK